MDPNVDILNDDDHNVVNNADAPGTPQQQHLPADRAPPSIKVEHAAIKSMGAHVNPGVFESNTRRRLFE